MDGSESRTDGLPRRLQALIDAGQQRRTKGYCGRFAPTPSGPLHRGNLRTALISWLAARLHNGTWLLRIDDLDTPRLRPGATEAAMADLRWLGLDWDPPVILQSARRGLYHTVLSHWRRTGMVYACRCSRRQLSRQRLYPGFCRDRRLGWGWEEQRLPAWRLRLAGDFAKQCGDLVVRRADGFIAYHLATAFDELALGISNVVRGADLAPVQTAQEAVIATMGPISPPRYQHVPLLCDTKGVKLSKRDGSQGLPPRSERPANAAAELGRLASGLQLIPPGNALSAQELLQHLRSRPEAFHRLASAESLQSLRDHGGQMSPH
jgi:glutamyl/glutaminyl-tRNA synthetase